MCFAAAPDGSGSCLWRAANWNCWAVGTCGEGEVARGERRSLSADFTESVEDRNARRLAAQLQVKRAGSGFITVQRARTPGWKTEYMACCAGEEGSSHSKISFGILAAELCEEKSEITQCAGALLLSRTTCFRSGMLGFSGVGWLGYCGAANDVWDRKRAFAPNVSSGTAG